MADNNGVKPSKEGKAAKKNNRAFMLGIVLVVLLIIGIIYFNAKFSEKDKTQDTQTPSEIQPKDTTSQEFADLQTADDDFTELDNSLAALG